MGKDTLLRECSESEEALTPIRRDILLRAAALLLVKDSKASYTIEGESPPAEFIDT